MMSDDVDLDHHDEVEPADERFEFGTTLFIAWAMLCLAILAILIMIGYNRPPAGL
jgi:hypothetical protein